MGWASALKKTPNMDALRAEAVQAVIARLNPGQVRPHFERKNVDWDRLVSIDFETYYDDDYTLSKYSTSEYVRELIRRDQRDQERLRLRALLEEGLASGPATPMTKADWAELDAIADGKAA